MADAPASRSDVTLVAHAGAVAFGLLAYLYVAPALIDGLLRDIPAASWLPALGWAAVALLVALWASMRIWGYLLPVRYLGILDPSKMGIAANWRFLGTVRRGDADDIADHLDAIRDVRAPEPRLWLANADAPEEERAMAYRAVQQVRERTRRWKHLGTVVAVGTAAGAMGLFWMLRDVLIDPSTSFGQAWAIAFGIAFVPGLVVLLVTNGALVRSWCGWYRDHVMSS